MSNSNYRALVVDDEPALRRLMVMALSKHGFACDHAENGEDALKHLATSQYHAVISDLAMPIMHGHALATQILSKPERPLLVIVTGVLEPRLAQDLLARGVDDIVFKPIEFQGFALKLKVMLDRRLSAENISKRPTTPAEPKKINPYDLNGLKPIAAEELERNLAGVASLVPISPAALDVYQLATTSDTSIPKLTAALKRDGALITETLRLANSSQLNHSTRRIATVEDAILQLGTARVAELALAMSALSAMSSKRIPWMDLDLEWRRSIAAGIALELILERASPNIPTDGLFLSVILHAMGRFILATLYPRHYEVLIDECAQRRSTLEEAERQVFPLDHASVLSRLLEQWKIAPEVYRPLAYLSTPSSALSCVPDNVRRQVELIQLATFLGRVAQGNWRPWDSVNFIGEAVLGRWGILDIRPLIERIHTQTRNTIGLRRQDTLPSLQVTDDSDFSATLSPNLPYWSRSSPGSDLIRPVLASAGFALETLQENQLAQKSAVLINSLEGVPKSMNPPSIAAQHHQFLLSQEPDFDLKGHLTLPCSFAALKMACLQLLPSSTVLVLDFEANPEPNICV